MVLYPYVREPYSMGRISQTDILTVGLLPQEQRQPLGEVAVASTGARLISGSAQL